MVGPTSECRRLMQMRRTMLASVASQALGTNKCEGTVAESRMACRSSSSSTQWTVQNLGYARLLQVKAAPAFLCL